MAEPNAYIVVKGEDSAAIAVHLQWVPRVDEMVDVEQDPDHVFQVKEVVHAFRTTAPSHIIVLHVKRDKKKKTTTKRPFEFLVR